MKTMKTMKKIYFLVIYMFLSVAPILAQVVVSDPELPIEDQPVTIYFDATKGTGGLAGYTGDVYAHTGVLTNKSTSTSNWKYVKTTWGTNTPDTKLTRVSADYYKLEITSGIRDYYGVPSDEKITHMAFVFRSASPYSGTTYYEGKDNGFKDILVEVFEIGLNVSIQNPERVSIQDPNSDILFNAIATVSADLTITENGNLVKKVTGTEISHVFNYSVPGDYEIIVKAVENENTTADTVFINIPDNQITEPLPDGMKDGINYIDDNTVTLVLFAPGKTSAYVIGDFNNWRPLSSSRMKKDADGKRFWLTISGLTKREEYAYQYQVDKDIFIADPYTDKVLDVWNDKYIEDSTYPDLKPFPYSYADETVSVFQTGQTGYEWQNTNFSPPEKENLVIYEMLLRDFVSRHDWKTLTDTLNYFSSLGVNAIEVMPFNEFEGNESWGYNPSFYFAPDKYYGPKNDLKAFVDSCHGRGIAVIMDMVLNHSYGQSPLVKLYFDPDAGDYGQPSADNPWYNQTSPNSSYSWGYDFNHESNDTKAFVDRVNKYWLLEYNLDGFRFDFTKGFTNTPGDGWAYDLSRINILKRMADSIWLAKPEAYVILEHFSNNTEEIELSDYGMMIWGNMNHAYADAAMSYINTSDITNVSYISRGWNHPNLVAYMESHDEERMMFRNITYGQESGNYDIKNFGTAAARVELAATFFFTVPGPKMIWQFEDIGYDYSIDFNGRVGNKPIRWDYYTSRYRLNRFFANLIALRQSEPAFQTANFEVNGSGIVKRIALNHDDMNVRVIGNFDLTTQSINPGFNNTGTWYEYFTGEELNVANTEDFIELQAGEYRLYTSKKLASPELPWSVNVKNKRACSIKMYPNPVKDYLYIESPSEINNIQIFDLSGRLLHSYKIESYNQTVNMSNMEKGFYLICIEPENAQKQIMRFVKD
jgi:1,4-alpha-glucan branching enzyme